jgi:hypothetical protein
MSMPNPGTTVDVVAAGGIPMPPTIETGIPIGTGPGTVASGTYVVLILGALQSGNNLSDLESVAEAIANLGLGSAALQPSSAFDADGTAQNLVNAEAATRAAQIAALQAALSALAATAWQPDTAYLAESVVTEGGNLYQAPSGGVPAESTFNPAQWVLLSSIGVAIDTTTGDIQPLGAAAAGTSTKAAAANHVHPTTGVLAAGNNLADVESVPAARTTLQTDPRAAAVAFIYGS